MRAVLARHDKILRSAGTARRGHVVKSTGDGVLAVFSSAADAVSAAVDAQRAMHPEQLPAVRMGIHTGEADERDGDYFGPAPNRGARLMSAAHGGQILVSLVTAGLLADMPQERVTPVDLG